MQAFHGEKQQCVYDTTLASNETFLVVVSCTKLGQPQVLTSGQLYLITSYPLDCWLSKKASLPSMDKFCLLILRSKCQIITVWAYLAQMHQEVYFCALFLCTVACPLWYDLRAFNSIVRPSYLFFCVNTIQCNEFLWNNGSWQRAAFLMCVTIISTIWMCFHCHFSPVVYDTVYLEGLSTCSIAAPLFCKKWMNTGAIHIQPEEYGIETLEYISFLNFGDFCFKKFGE